LIAWHVDEPVGHFLVRWNGPPHDLTGQYPPHTPYLEAGVTKPVHRRRGVGTRIILEAERLVRAKGYKQLGLTVAFTDNPLARQLYERLGYRGWGMGEFAASWEYETEDGRKATGSGVYIYMFKDL
jgi:GNAT superfamily N-acetyltransferase